MARARLALLAVLGARLACGATEPGPDNQVFQFAVSATCTAWRDGSRTSATAYLWVPEACRRLRGLLILCANVPEHRLVGHPALRDVCRARDLGLVWCPQSFMNFSQKPGQPKMEREHETTAAFLEQLLAGLAGVSGYDEVATVPWLPIGESGHLLMVDALVEARPQRCLAGVWLKNSHLPPTNRTVPALVVFGTAQEWGQEKTDYRTRWRDVTGIYDGVLKQRAAHPDWPLSYVVDGSSGHFDCSERLTAYLAHYIDAVASARLTDAGLQPLRLDQGWVADLPVPGHALKPPARAAGQPLAWFLDEASALEAQSFAAINWQAQSQLPGTLDEDGKVLPFAFNGIVDFLPKLADDGVTFTVRGQLLDRLPANFVGAGEPLATTPGEPTVEWLSGPAQPLGGGRFRLVPGRAGGPIYVALRQRGTADVRAVVQPIHIEYYKLKHNAGRAQTIAFDPLPDVRVGTASLPLHATSDAGLPVSFYVESGPAVIDGDRLAFTGIPPRAKLPLAVTVVAWQWGRGGAAPVRTAEPVKRVLRLTAAAG